MKFYLVGGALRDELLGLKGSDKDYVVVGSSREAMLAQGFKPVGKDFPVFLHPKTKEEYALARTERKISQGYKGFAVETEAVSLEADLWRRDLTINAMAKDIKTGEIIDPFGGQQDLAQGLLHHVSAAFSEDPVRILRVARFAARFKPYGFKVAHSTQQLMKYMVDCGEVDSLVPERVWAELEKVLSYSTPSAFFKVLAACGALAIVLPGLENLELENSKNEVQTHHNRFLYLDALKSSDIAIRWALVCHQLSEAQLQKLCHQINCPRTIKDLAVLTVKYHQFVPNLTQFNTSEILAFYKKSDALRRKERFAKLLVVFDHLEIDTQKVRQIWQDLLNINIKQFKPQEIATALPKRQYQIVKEAMANGGQTH